MDIMNIVRVPIKIPLEMITYSQIPITNYSTNITINNIDLNESSLNVRVQDEIQYIDNIILQLDELPSNMSISTISVTGKINCKMLLENIDKYIRLSDDGILSVKYGGKIRSLEKKLKSRKKKDIRCFENQLTMEVRVNGDKKINVKIFKNGSFQMTGCKSIKDCNTVLNRLINKLSNVYAIIDVENNKIIEKIFMDEINKEDGIKVNGFKVDMINSNFRVPYLINREALYNILLNQKINCRYEPCIHACVNIKYSIENDPTNKVVSIFVFQSGNIIITGARTRDQINSSYRYITEILEKYHDLIVKKDLINMLDNNDLKEILAELDVINMEEIEEIEKDNILV
jgi:TATA-box binding protein (TBP) (component of TFIID and TFIIIB)